MPGKRLGECDLICTCRQALRLPGFDPTIYELNMHSSAVLRIYQRQRTMGHACVCMCLRTRKLETASYPARHLYTASSSSSDHFSGAGKLSKHRRCRCCSGARARSREFYFPTIIRFQPPEVELSLTKRSSYGNFFQQQCSAAVAVKNRRKTSWKSPGSICVTTVCGGTCGAGNELPCVYICGCTRRTMGQDIH